MWDLFVKHVDAGVMMATATVTVHTQARSRSAPRLCYVTTVRTFDGDTATGKKACEHERASLGKCTGAGIWMAKMTFRTHL